MMKVRHLSTLMALGALVALSACAAGNQGSTQAAAAPAAVPPPAPAPAPAPAAAPAPPPPAAASMGSSTRPHAVSPGQIRAVQDVLRRSGQHQLVTDGRQGPATTRAVQRWQRDHGLRPTGIIDPATLQSMNIH